MGYACPVCEDPQSDAGHLANHLAFTAISSGGNHEEWLDEHVPGWGQLGKSELAEEVVGMAEETEFPQVFEESGLADADDHQHDHSAGDQTLADHDVDPSSARSRGTGELDEEARAIMEEARELTEEMRGEDDGPGGDAPEGSAGDDGDSPPDDDES